MSVCLTACCYRTIQKPLSLYNGSLFYLSLENCTEQSKREESPGKHPHKCVHGGEVELSPESGGEKQKRQ